MHFVGGVTHSQLPPYLLSADCLVLPSDSVESFGLVLIEAMACGLPVVASNLPGVRTTVRHENDGYLVPPGGRRLARIGVDSANWSRSRRAKSNGNARTTKGHKGL